MKLGACFFRLAGLLVLASPSNLYSADLLEDMIETPLEYEIYYTDDPAKAPHTCPRNHAQWVADAVDRCHQVFVNQAFKAPWWSDREGEIYIQDPSVSDAYGKPDFGGIANPGLFLLNVKTAFGFEALTRVITLHELFHHVQFAYEHKETIGWPLWLLEGQACLMQDKTFQDLDNDPVASDYRSRARFYLNIDKESPLFSLEYTANVFWTYFAERLGRAQYFDHGNLLNVGTFQLVQYLGYMARDVDPVLSMNNQLASYCNYEPGATFKSYFRDFMAALYAKDFALDTQDQQRKFGFIDEDIVQQPVGVQNRSIDAGYNDEPVTLFPWSAKHFNFQNDTAVDSIWGIRARSTDNKPFAVSLIPISTDTPGHVRDVIQRYGTEMAIAFYNDPTLPVLQVGAAFTAFEDKTTLSLDIVGGDATLSLNRPSASWPAYIGEGRGNKRILARVRVAGPAVLGTPSVKGLTARNFTAEVGTGSCQIQSCIYVRGDYWLVLIPPNRPGLDDRYPLQIHCLGQFAAQEGAVIYRTLAQNQILVIDRSGSMAFNDRLPAAKVAAFLMVDAAPEVDSLGVVAFDGGGLFPLQDDADLLCELTPMYSVEARVNAQLAILGIEPGLATSIGDGLKKGQDELDAHGAATQPHVMILLSDGEENDSLWWADVKDDIIAKGTVIHTVGLGAGTYNATLEGIAQATKGDYYYVPADPGGAKAAGRRSTDYAPQSLAVRMADTYLRIEDRIQDRVRLWSKADRVDPGGTAEYPIRLREGAVTQAVLSAVWANAETSFTMRVYDPDGFLVTNGTPGVDIFQTATHEVYQFGTMSTGSWTVLVDSLGATTSEFQAALSGEGNLACMGTWLDGSSNLTRRLAGDPIGMRAVLSDAFGPILNAEVVVTVLHPDGTTNRFRLRDDGMHGDDNDGDGIYAFPYARTTQEGSYLFAFQAQGQTSSSANFYREESRSTYVTYDPEYDGDSDGMADPWELLHVLDPDSDDSAYDFDGDGLSNLLEFMAGCDPRIPDTDGGGITDGSEVALSRDTLEELDDDVARPSWGEVVVPRGCTASAYTSLVQTNALLVRFPVCPTYRFVHLFRSTMETPLESYVRVKKLDVHAYPGLYLDPGLENDQSYYYYFIAEGTNEQFTAPSPVFSGIPKADPIPPGGWVKINGGARRTTSLDVTLTFDPVSDATEMMVSEDPAFATDTWIPKVNSMPWTLTPYGSAPLLGTVYAKFRRGPSNNESGICIATIEYDPDGDADDDGLADDIDLDDDNDGIPNDVESNSGLDPYRTDTNGDGIGDTDDDPDHDGQTTRDELSGGSGPGDPDSRFQVLRIALTDGFCRVAAPYASGRNIRLQMTGLGLENGESWSNAPLSGSVVGSELRWDTVPGDVLSFYRVAANPYISADFTAIDKDDIAAAAVTGDSISGDDDDNQLTPGSIILCHTSQGRFTKLLIESWGYDLGLRWATYDADGSLYSSGTGLLITGTWACDLDEGLEAEADCDFRWDQFTGTERSLTPHNGAKFIKIH